MTRCFSSILVLFFIGTITGSAQKSLSDSVYVLYEQYFDMLRVAEQTSKELAQKLDSISKTVTADVEKVNKNYQYYNEVLEANNKKISSISETQLYTNKTLVERNVARTVSSAEFVEAASTALNALDLTNQIFVYTDQITALNNPENTDLGFSLARRVNTILEEEVFKGRTKINKVRKERFLSIVDNILKSPITNSFMEGLPVVGSIKSVVDLVVNLSLQGEEISVVEVAELKNKLSDYVAYYQGLEKALRQFESKVNSIDVRTEALKLLLKNYVQDRVKTIYPKIASAKMEVPLNQILMDAYNYPSVQKEIRRILADDYTDGRNNVFYSLAVNDQRLRFPDFAVGQARFIADEIETIVSEYEAALTIYQKRWKKC
ncbi:MAG: hypothetical protein HC912_03620 [Saprospiraceae bacterium]|nr:hypothetical protein [Saprospiraceae bacterium]